MSLPRILSAILVGAFVGFPPLVFGVDCNGNGSPDAGEIRAGRSEDCNGNGVPGVARLLPHINTESLIDYLVSGSNNQMNKSKNILLLFSGILMLLAVIGGWPYGFYTFLRILVDCYVYQPSSHDACSF